MTCKCNFSMFFVRAHEPACTCSQLEHPPNSVLLGRCVWLVRAGRQKPRLVHRIFFLLSPNPGAFVIFTHRFWRGVGNHIRLWRTQGTLAQELKFCGTLNLFVHSFLATLCVTLTPAVRFTLAPKSSQLPKRFHSSKSQHF